MGGLAAAALAPAASPAAPPPPVLPPVGTIGQVATRAVLAGVSAQPGQAVLLTEPGREGFFVLREGPAVNDPLQGLTVPSAAGARHWARLWDGKHGLPEWFGAHPRDRDFARANVAAILACFALCPVTQLTAATYYVSDTLRLRVSNRVLLGAGIAVEPPYDTGTRILCTDPSKDVIRVGGDGPGDRPGFITVEGIAAGWTEDLVVPPEGRECDAPAAFHATHVLAVMLRGVQALDPLIGFRFNGIINSRCVTYGVIRYKSYRGAGRDFLRGVWAQGRPRLFAGGNASLYLIDGNVTTSAQKRAAFYRPTGIYADADFADLYIDGFETSQIAFPIVLDGAGGDFIGGHGDVHIRAVVLDQIIGDGITVRNTNALAKIQIDGGYIQIVDSRQSNKGLWLENGGGQITVSNLQITGDDATTSIGIYLKDRPNVAIDDTVIVENVAFPVRVEKGCPRLSLACSANAGMLPPRGHAAVTVDGASQSVLRPKVTGKRGVWTAGIELVGMGHDRVSIDPTMVDPTSVAAGRKLVINGRPVTTPGHHAPGGERSAGETGVAVTGVVG